MTELSLRHINEHSAHVESLTLHPRREEEGTLFDLVELLSEKQRPTKTKLNSSKSRFEQEPGQDEGYVE